MVRHKSEGLDLITLEISSRFMFPKDGILTETSLAESLGKAPKIVRLIMQSQETMALYIMYLFQLTL